MQTILDYLVRSRESWNWVNVISPAKAECSNPDAYVDGHYDATGIPNFDKAVLMARFAPGASLRVPI